MFIVCVFAELLVKELEILVRGKTTKVPFLESLLSDIPSILPLLLSPHPLHTSTAVTMLSFIGKFVPWQLSRTIRRNDC